MSERCGYRKDSCSDTGATIKGIWTCSKHQYADELQALRDENARLTKVLVQYKNLWALRGEALKRPCLSCGYVQKQIVPMEGSGNE